MDRQLIFREFLPINRNIRKFADRVWIHPKGKTVVLLDGVSGCADPVGAAETCISYLTQLDSELDLVEPRQLLLDLHNNIISNLGQMSVAACVHFENDHVCCSWVGNPRLYLTTDKSIESLLGDPLSQPTQVLGMEGVIDPMTKTFVIPSGGICLLTSDGLGHEALLKKKSEIQNAHKNRDWYDIGEETAIDEDWSLVVFPIEQSFNFEKSCWPYNPFVGHQEDCEHEKKGLAQLADVLFSQADFDGFRIVGGTRFARSNSSRLLDGILVCPWGVVCLELKDHDGQVLLPLSQGREMVVYDGPTHHVETNPVTKLTEALRPFSNFDFGCDVRTEIRNIGAVIFTHPEAQVLCMSHDGSAQSPPLTTAEVIVTKPSDFPQVLKQYVKKFVGKRSNPPLDIEQIETICKKLGGLTIPNLETSSSRRKVGKFILATEPNKDESTSYYDVFEGTFCNRDKKVWVKKFPRVQLARGKQSQVEESRLREIEALLQFSSEGAIQKYLGHVTEEDGLFVALEYIDGPRLDEWLASNPTREERLNILRQITKILGLLEQEQIVHRGLSPRSIRIRATNGQVVLVNFELCQMDVVATLPLSGRRLFDLQYVAKEVHALGRHITSSADIYSFGKIACLVLSGELPFRTFEEQPMVAKKTGFWEKVSIQCGLTEEQGVALSRILSINPDRRPSVREIISMLEEWR